MTVHYGKIEAVKRISLELPDASAACLIGVNAAGKSTTLRAILGLKALTSGEIWFGGSRIDGLSTVEIVRMGIALCPEGRRVFPYLTVEENLGVGGHFLRPPQLRRNLQRIYSSFPVLEHKRKQTAGSMSGGEQQMLALGRALITDPKVLLLDEPCMGLSPLLVQELSRIMKSIAGEGVTTFPADQNLSFAVGLSDKAYVMESGKIVFEGATDELANHEDFKRYLVGA